MSNGEFQATTRNATLSILLTIVAIVSFTHTPNKLIAGDCSAEVVASKPNIILVMADDLGINELSCYGSKVIKTPHIDQIAREGMTFWCAYSGSTVCAPARCSLLTGQHTGQCSVRVNTGGVPLPDRDVTMAEMLKACGYATGGFGKWALGIEGSEGDPLKQGFDEFYGYYHQTHAHNHYPEYLVHNGVAEKLIGNFETDFDDSHGVFLADKNPRSGETLAYAPYLIMDKAEQFIRRNSKRPFFCYLPVTLPHGHFHIPKSDPATAGIDGRSWSNKSKGVAALTQLLDRQMGNLMKLLKELQIDDNTIVIFCSDHGAARRLEGELDRSGPFRGQKRSVYEGGLRTPLIVRWPKAVKAGSASRLPVYLGDLFATFRQVAVTDQQTRHSIGEMLKHQPQHSISLLPTLLGKDNLQEQHDFFVWDWAAFNPQVERWYDRRQAIRSGNWKLLRHTDDEPWELYDLASDPFEAKNLADSQPGVVATLAKKIAANVVNPVPQPEAMVHWMRDLNWANRGQGIRLRAKSIEEIVDSSPTELKNIAFSEDAVLKGISSVLDSEGNLHLNFAWDLKAGRRTKRFIHVCDAARKTIVHGPMNEQLFSDTSQDKQIMDYVALRAEELTKAHSVAIGFYDPTRKSSVVVNGSQANRGRLTIWEKPIAAQSSSSKSEIPGWR
jgi:arylsulfatase A-like enzyme